MHISSFSDAQYHYNQKETNTILLDFNFNFCNCIYCSGNFTFWSSLLFVILFVIQIIIGRSILEFFFHPFNYNFLFYKYVLSKMCNKKFLIILVLLSYLAKLLPNSDKLHYKFNK